MSHVVICRLNKASWLAKCISSKQLSWFVYRQKQQHRTWFWSTIVPGRSGEWLMAVPRTGKALIQRLLCAGDTRRHASGLLGIWRRRPHVSDNKSRLLWRSLKVTNARAIWLTGGHSARDSCATLSIVPVRVEDTSSIFLDAVAKLFGGSWFAHVSTATAFTHIVDLIFLKGRGSFASGQQANTWCRPGEMLGGLFLGTPLLTDTPVVACSRKRWQWGLFVFVRPSTRSGHLEWHNVLNMLPTSHGTGRSPGLYFTVLNGLLLSVTRVEIIAPKHTDSCCAYSITLCQASLPSVIWDHCWVGPLLFVVSCTKKDSLGSILPAGG